MSKKKKTILVSTVVVALVVVVSVFLYLSRPVEAAEPNTTLQIDKGAVLVNGKQATSGQRLSQNDTVKTEKDSQATINFFDKSASRLDANTEIVLATLTSSNSGATTNVGIKAKVGHIWSRVVKLVDKESSFEVETPTTVATVRGTAFDAQIGEDGKENLVVTENVVSATIKDTENIGKALASTDLIEGNETSIDSKNMPKQPKDMMGIVSEVTKEKMASAWVKKNKESDKKFEEEVSRKEEQMIDDMVGIAPDSAFYGLKQLAQNTRVALAFNDSAKAGLQVAYANQKLAEASQMITEGKGEIAKKAMAGYAKGLERALSNIDQMKNKGQTEAYQKISEKIQEQVMAQKNLVATSLSDDPTYIIKQAIERAQIKMAADGGQQVSLGLEQAKERLKEAKKLMEENKGDLAKKTLEQYGQTFEEANKIAQTMMKQGGTDAVKGMADETTSRTMEAQLFMKTMEDLAPPEMKVKIMEQKIKGLEQAKQMIEKNTEKMQEFQQEMMKNGASTIPAAYLGGAPVWVKEMETQRAEINKQIQASLPKGVILPAGFIIPDFAPAGSSPATTPVRGVPDMAKFIPQNFQSVDMSKFTNMPPSVVGTSPKFNETDQGRQTPPTGVVVPNTPPQGVKPGQTTPLPGTIPGYSGTGQTPPSSGTGSTGAGYTPPATKIPPDSLPADPDSPTAPTYVPVYAPSYDTPMGGPTP